MPLVLSTCCLAEEGESGTMNATQCVLCLELRSFRVAFKAGIWRRPAWPQSLCMLFPLRHAVADLQEFCTKAFGWNLNRRGESVSGVKFWHLQACMQKCACLWQKNGEKICPPNRITLSLYVHKASCFSCFTFHQPHNSHRLSVDLEGGRALMLSIVSLDCGALYP